VKHIEDLEPRAPLTNVHADKSVNVTICYVIFVAYTACLYAVGQKSLFELDQKIVPSGDAMTYVIFFYQILNQLQGGFSSALWLIAHENYNWLQDFLILVFSPILYNERSSLIIINYVLFLISIILIFRTALLCKVPHFLAFGAALLFAAMPWNFQLRMEFNLTSLMPDPVYVYAYLCASILFCWFISEPSSRPIAIATGLALGVAIWSRWNAAINLSMLVAGFGLVATMRFAFFKSQLTAAMVKNCGILALICTTCAAIYVWFEYRAILGYGLQIAISSPFDLQTKIAGAEWLLFNMPGLAIAGQWFYPETIGTPLYATVLTILAHAAVVYSAVSGVRKISSDQQSEILVGALGLIGATIFYLGILLAVSTFGGYYARPEVRELHLVEPVFVGLICSALSFICGLLSRRTMPQWKYVNYGFVSVVLGVLITLNSSRIVKSSAVSVFDDSVWTSPNIDYGLKKTDIGVPECEKTTSLPGNPQIYLPNDGLRNLVLRLREAATAKNVSFLWYGQLNPQIMNYYTAQTNLSPIKTVRERSPQDEYVWYITFDPKRLVTEPWFRDWLKYIFANADFVVIPERVNAYDQIWSSPIVAYRDDIVAALNSPETAPDYLVWGVIDERETRVLILKKRDPRQSDEGLEPFPRTWGTPAQVIGRDFRGALMLTPQLRSPIQANTTTVILFTYRNFNILKLGDLYLAIAQELGAIDLEAILAKMIPAPTGQFIVAADVASLERAIDASILACQSLPARTPVLLYTYKTYKIVHAGHFYVGIAWDVGQIDVDAALANRAPRPPESKFIVAESIPSLKAKIDDMHPVTNPVLHWYDRLVRKSLKWIQRIRG